MGIWEFDLNYFTEDLKKGWEAIKTLEEIFGEGCVSEELYDELKAELDRREEEDPEEPEDNYKGETDIPAIPEDGEI